MPLFMSLSTCRIDTQTLYIEQTMPPEILPLGNHLCVCGGMAGSCLNPKSQQPVGRQTCPTGSVFLVSDKSK